MLVNRRKLLSAAGLSASGLLAAPRLGRAAAEELIITPVTPSSGQATPYGRFSNDGPFGMPVRAIPMEAVSGLRLSLYLPPRQTHARVIIFSHSELATPQSYERLFGHWASHGYAVIAPLHDDSVVVAGLKARQHDLKGGKWDLGSLINDVGAWKARPQMCSAALSALPRIQQYTGVQLIDERPIIAGHGFGAFTAAMLIGAKAFLQDDQVIDERDARFYGAVLMSPPSRNSLGLRPESWGGVDRPLIAITGNGDTDSTGQDPNAKLDSFAMTPPGNRHLAWCSQVYQTLYTGQQIPPNSTRMLVFQDILAVSTAFISAYADYDQKTFLELSGNYYESATMGRMMMRYR